jgi:hypothetical protein
MRRTVLLPTGRCSKFKHWCCAPAKPPPPTLKDRKETADSSKLRLLFQKTLLRKGFITQTVDTPEAYDASFSNENDVLEDALESLV